MYKEVHKEDDGQQRKKKHDTECSSSLSESGISFFTQLFLENSDNFTFMLSSYGITSIQKHKFQIIRVFKEELGKKGTPSFR